MDWRSNNRKFLIIKAFFSIYYRFYCYYNIKINFFQVAASEDYGRDVEHVELLIQIFDNFLAGLTTSEGRVSAVLDEGQKLIQENNPEKTKILMKIDETKQQWEDLKELAHARQDALAGAKQVHMFDRTADETISWIQEKETALSSDGYGHDLETIQALVRKHQGFETDLGAVKEQVFHKYLFWCKCKFKVQAKRILLLG